MIVWVILNKENKIVEIMNPDTKKREITMWTNEHLGRAKVSLIKKEVKK